MWCSPLRVLSGVSDLLGERELVTSHTGTHCVYALLTGEIKPFGRDKICGHTNFKILIEVCEVVQHVGVLIIFTHRGREKVNTVTNYLITVRFF